MHINKDFLINFYKEALKKNKFRNWWPAESEFEIILGAILTQNSSWSNVEKALDNLKEADLLDPFALERIPIDQLANIIRPSGYFNQKAKKIKSYLDWQNKYDHDLQKIKKIELNILRSMLLDIWGIGPETADSILLYAFEKDIFVVDKYTYRIAHRHKWWGIDKERNYNPRIYQKIQNNIMNNLALQIPGGKKRIRLFNDFHAQIVFIGHNYCKNRPVCGQCPWGEFL